MDDNNRDNGRAPAGQDYEVAHFAERHMITIRQAHELIKLHGNDRDKLEEEAAKLSPA